MYTIGLDYGTLSGRALLVDVRTGEELATAVYDYPHAVIDEILPESKRRLPPEWALQHPKDYLDVIYNTIPAVIKDIDPQQVIGIGIDFTASTPMPTLRAVSYTHLTLPTNREV